MGNYKLRKRFADDIKWGTLIDGSINPNTLNAMERFHNKAVSEAVKDFATELLTKFDENATREKFGYLDSCIQGLLATSQPKEGK